MISTHTPLAGRDSKRLCGFTISSISTHTPLAGRDCDTRSKAARWLEFLLTRPLRDVTGNIREQTPPTQFLLTRPLRDVTRYNDAIYKCQRISTHTPLAGRDRMLKKLEIILVISTHTPLAGRDTVYHLLEYGVHLFLLTRPLRDVTVLPFRCTASCDHFYSHAPCGT